MKSVSNGLPYGLLSISNQGSLSSNLAMRGSHMGCRIVSSTEMTAEPTCMKPLFPRIKVTRYVCDWRLKVKSTVVPCFPRIISRACLKSSPVTPSTSTISSPTQIVPLACAEQPGTSDDTMSSRLPDANSMPTPNVVISCGCDSRFCCGDAGGRLLSPFMWLPNCTGEYCVPHGTPSPYDLPLPATDSWYILLVILPPGESTRRGKGAGLCA